ncbi:MAG: chromosomal replication initiator protein DnaA [Candidatus Eisenbacteria bacterium]|nr:chromosomal replication initiator protein DnaA [Candidatus Eisenbacteria bacterium]
MTEQRFTTWFRPIVPREFEEDRVVLEVPNPFFVDWFEEHNLPLLRQAIRESLGWEPAVDFAVKEDYKELFRKGLGRQAAVQSPFATPARAAPANSNLNPRFSFDNFVVGRSNELAHAACQAVAKDPGHVYNPLFIYGGVGLGKTHLMHAVGLAIATGSPSAKVHYVGSETFMNEMIEAIRAGTTMEFRDHYRSLDLLLIDDIQFLSGRGRTEEEFFHTFNSLYDASKQVVVSCDRPPSDLVTLEERLTSRFQCGLVADIHPPDLETRVAILRQRSARDGLSIPDRVIFLLAEQIRANIRELEGALIRLSALASLTGSAITEELARDALRDYMKNLPGAAPDVTTIQRVVSKCFDVTVESLRGKRRTSQVALARQVAMYTTKQLTGLTLVEIGKRFGNRDHSTVIHALNRVGEELKRSESLRATLTRIEEELAAGGIGQRK